MTDHAAIDKPGEDVLLHKPHRGDIRCRILRIGRKGSVFGNVVADEIWVAGRFDGVAHAGKFFSAAGSKVIGAVNAAVIGIKPGTAVRAHFGPEFPAQRGAALLDEEDILRSIEEDVAKVMESSAALKEASQAVASPEKASPEPSAVPAPAAAEAAAAAAMPGLEAAIEEALRPLSRESLAEATAAAQALARPARRAALPSLV